MNKFIFTILLFASIAANGQFNAGDRYLGGNIGIGFSNSSYHYSSSASNNSVNSFGISLNPHFFKAVKSKSAPSIIAISDPTINNLINQLNILILERDDLAARVGDKDSAVIDLNKQIETVKESLLNQFKKQKITFPSNSNTLRGFTFGLGFSNSFDRGNQTNSIKNNNNDVSASIGYAIRKYKPLSEKLFWYMEYSVNFGYNYSSQKATYTNPSSTIKSDGMGYNAGINVLPALALKIDNRLLVDVNFGGLSTGYYYSSSEGNHSHSYNVSLNLTSRFSLGIFWKFIKPAHS